MTVVIIQCFCPQELYHANCLRSLLQNTIFHKELNNQFLEIDDDFTDFNSVYSTLLALDSS